MAKLPSKKGLHVAIIARHLDLPVGFGTYANNLVDALAELKTPHRFTVYSPHKPKRTKWPKNFQVRHFGVPQVRSKLSKWEHFTAPLAAKKDGADVVHFLHTANSIPPIRRPVIVGVLDAIGWVLPGYKLPLAYQVLARRDIAFASHLITLSESAKEDINRLLHVKPAKISVTPLAGPPVEAKAAKKKPYFLFVGGTERRKNLHTVLEALAGTDFDGYTLKVIGPIEASPIADDWQELTQLLPKDRQPQVDWLGRVTDVELAKLYREATALVYPTLYEGFGLPILEAMARHTPVIAGNRSSLPEVAGDAAILVDPEDAAELAKAMQRITSDAALRKRLVAKGLKVAKSFSWRHTAEQTVKVYEQVAK